MKENFSMKENLIFIPINVTNKLLKHITIATCCWLFVLGLGVHIHTVITLHGNGMKRITKVTFAPTLMQLINQYFLTPTMDIKPFRIQRERNNRQISKQRKR
jgi:hypothetical protein